LLAGDEDAVKNGDLGRCAVRNEKTTRYERRSSVILPFADVPLYLTISSLGRAVFVVTAEGAADAGVGKTNAFIAEGSME
jgi:hypothetical protein